MDQTCAHSCPVCLQPVTTGLQEGSGGSAQETTVSAVYVILLELLISWKKNGEKLRKKVNKRGRTENTNEKML